MAIQHPIDYLVNRHRSHGIDMDVICDGEVLYDEGIFPNFRSSMCPYHHEQRPHMILQSKLRNGKKFVVVEEPDLENSGAPKDGLVEVPSIYTAKVVAELDDIHKSDGYHAIRFRPDGSIDRVFSKDGTATHRELPVWLDFLVAFYLE